MLGSGVPMLQTSIYCVCAMNNKYINIKEIAQAKGLKKYPFNQVGNQQA